MMFRRRLWLATFVLATLVFYYKFNNRAHSPVTDNTSHGNKKIHLSQTQPKYVPSALTALPQGKAKTLPDIQADFTTTVETAVAKKVRLERQAAVREAFLHAWGGYKFHAFGKDEVRPLSGGWRDSLGGWGVTMIDTMDFLWLLGLKGDFDMCVDAVGKIDFSTNTEEILNVFEVNIRYLGGLLAAYEVSDQKYTILLEKARELGDILYMAFDTSNRMPVTRWEWKKTAHGLPLDQKTDVLLAELGSLTLEFTRLSQLTKDPKYYDAVNRISEHLYSAQNHTKIPGLWPTIVNPKSLDFSYNHFTFGGMVDSAYEYLPKQFMMLGGLVNMYQDMYRTAIEVGKKHLFYRPRIPSDQNILLSGNAALHEDREIVTEAQAQHLSCFVGGMVAMASKLFSMPSDMEVARRLVDGCIWAYDAMPSGIMPEIFHVTPCHVGAQHRSHSSPADDECTWDDQKWYTAIAVRQGRSDATASMSQVQAGKHWVKTKSLQRGFTDQPDNTYMLRPEAIESIFILYRTTGDNAYLDKAWTMFQSIQKATRTQIAHAGIHDVRAATGSLVRSDRMESFWLAETLKYFWLIFAEPNVASLDDWIFNTEAHMFKRPKPGQHVD